MTSAYADSVVLVTGASTGLGRAIARGAAEAGARAVIVNYASSEGEAEATAAQVRSAGAEAVLARGDVGDHADCERIAAAAAPFGRIDALFNNAGISKAGAFDAFTAEDLLAIYRVNVAGAYQMTMAALALLRAAPAGAVVNTSSLAGVTGLGSSLAYTVSKGALNTLGKVLAGALAPEIRVNTICPGFIDTEWFDRHPPAGGAERLREHVRNTSPLRSLASADDVAACALFLGSPAARQVTGEILLVDGGSHLGKA